MIAAALALLLAPGDKGDIDRLIRGTYALYVGADAMPRPAVPLAPQLVATEAECARLQKLLGETAAGMCEEDRDVLCQCRNPHDVDWTKIGVQVWTMRGGLAQAVIDFPLPRATEPNGKRDILWLLEKRDGSWQIEDLGDYTRFAIGGEASYLKRLTTSIQTMRTRLNLPAWVYDGPRSKASIEPVG